MRVAFAVDLFVVQLDSGQHVFELGDGTHDVGAFHRMLLHDLKFFVGKRARLLEHAVVDAYLAHVVQQRGDAQAVKLGGAQAQAFADGHGIFCNAPGMAARVGVLFVDGRGKHADGPDKKLTVFFRRLLEFLDVLLNVAGHAIEGSRQVADLRSTLNRGALLELPSADGQGRFG